MFNLRTLDLNLLTVFEAVYEVGTVSSAADRLGLSQSAASHALSRLRDACGDELFARGRLGLVPTPVAKAMYPAVHQALASLRTGLTEATGFDPKTSDRHFHLSVPHPMGPFYALALRAEAAACAPGIQLTFETVSRPIGLEDNIRDGIVDIAIDWLPVELDPFINQRIFDDRLMLVARSNHPSVDKDVTLDQLRQEEFVTLHRRRAAEHAPQAIKDLSNLGLQETVRVSELLEIPAVVASTNLLGVFPLSMGQLMQERLGLQVFAFPIELASLPVYMVWHESRRQETAHRWLRDLVATQVARTARGG